MLRVLLLGSTGLLGTELHKVLKETTNLYAPTRNYLDLNSYLLIEEYFKYNPKFDVVINCTGYNKVDQAEVDKENCWYDNVDMPVFIATELAKKYPDTKFIQFSSDYVFDGENPRGYYEISKKNPISYYGLSKSACEDFVMKANNKAIIVRTSWLFGPAKPNFVYNILNAYKTNGEVSVVDDQIGCPTYTVDIANNVHELLNLEPGIYHFVNEGNCSWHELAKLALSYFYDEPNIKAIKTADLKSFAKRPKCSILHNRKLKKLPNFKVSLEDYLKNLSI